MGYVLGSIPVAYLATRAWGANIFEIGTRNPGAANVFRAVSRPLGVAVLAFDTLKGFLAVVLANVLGVTPELASVAGAAAIVGHWHPVFLKFRGGAAMATAIGAGIGLAPILGLSASALGTVTLLIIRNTGYSAFVGYLGFVGLSPFLGKSWETTLGATLLITMVWLRSIAVSVLPKGRNRV